MKENMEWNFSDAKNTAVFTTRQVVNEGMPILFVSHDEDDGYWQFNHGGNVNIEDAMIVSLQHMVNLDDTLNQLFDLPLGWIARRKNTNDTWDKRENRFES